MIAENVELLAPAGKWDVLECVAAAGADAVYCGGKRFNMRMLKPGFNFDDSELARAAEFLHSQNKKLYITINNLYFDDELEEMRDYLQFLQDIQVDALIIQDMAVAQLHRELQLHVPLHASVQMGISSLKAVQFLEDLGFTRAVLSKNLSIDEIAAIYRQAQLTIEFFAHGDLCIAHAGQCTMSSLLAGRSGNRGLCIKPCRWPYTLQAGNKNDSQAKYYLAHNDLCVYPYTQQLLTAGVRSFKIEGRMREGDYLSFLVRAYREAIDNIISNPDLYRVDDQQMVQLEEKRVRDFTGAGLIQRPGQESIGLSGEREPFFPTEAFVLNRLKTQDYQEAEQQAACSLELSVRVAGPESYADIASRRVNNIILGINNMRQDIERWEAGSINEILRSKAGPGRKVLIEAPRIVTEQDIKNLDAFLNSLDAGNLAGILVSDYGSLKIVRGMGITPWAAGGLNVTNRKAAQILAEHGVQRVTVSPELQMNEVYSLLQAPLDMEMLVHGPLCGMISDYCLPRGLSGDEIKSCGMHCLLQEYQLVDACGQQYRIRTGEDCRSYIFHPYDQCLFHEIPRLAAAGLKSIRIDGQYYSTGILLELVDIYLQALSELAKGSWEQKSSFEKILQMFPGGLTPGAAGIYTTGPV